MTDMLTKLDDPDLPFAEKVIYIKGAYTPLDICEQLEVPVYGSKIQSPFNEHDQTPSCHLYEDGWFDYSTGQWGDVIDLVEKLSGWSTKHVVDHLCRGIQGMELDEGRVKRAARQVNDLTELYMDLSGELGVGVRVAQAWMDRLPGVSETHLRLLFLEDRLGVDEAGNLLIPHWHDRIVTGIKVRHLDGRKTSVSGSSFSVGLYETLAYRWDQVAVPAVIVEGESDCWALERQLMNVAHVYALPSGAGLWRDAWLEQLAGYETIYTAFDNDRAGQQATEKVRSSIGWGRWKELKVPTLYNDVREAIVAGWEPKL